MKKLFIGIVILAALTALSCQTTGQTLSGAKIDGEVTQRKVDSALDHIYNTYRGKLDMTGSQEYFVQSGDTLSQITRKYYGHLNNVGEAGVDNGFYFPIVMLASTDSHILDPDLIEPRMKLVIIDLQRNLANSSSRKAIKDCLNDVAYIYNRKGRPAEEEGLKKLSNSL